MVDVQSLSELEATPHAVVFPSVEPKTVRLDLTAGESVPPHEHPDREIVLYILEGQLDLTVAEETYELTAGDVARFDGAQDISPTAIEDSRALLVLAKRCDRD
ncbi:cupin domain-containing protein [Halalkalirubrum salinum]|uniref:cupin domain-containing protein n=1 Tax=Halalkalirubrum salinum TaxID=2563889 RepID=UPI0010FB237C|nr:cupin domain-containing protein [Halalkalirubrum salinum]